ncbi:nuclear transport factor 2 family protein [uncultured Shewanella sp.]|uniref:nuclear transport factor 2 family protein n=1 Tax=uncultured Shewanella sp. TaxID=173975 RepID=UPI002620F3E7|nr:nuclear transport factor 2 family protein [uncultured Shewanella sp.]
MIPLKSFSFVLLLLFPFTALSTEPRSPLMPPFEQTIENTVKRFIAAFNAHDSHAMANLVTDDIEWLSISNKKVMIEARGKQALIESMNAYFKACPTCRSELTHTISTNQRVSAVEVAHWQGKNGPSSQQSMSVYAFSNGMISRVYYFPAE